MRRLLVLIPLLILMTAALMPIHAQQGTEETASAECVALVETALASLAENCSAVDGGAACVGFNNVSASYSGDEVPFSDAGDTSSLDALQSINAGGLDLEAEQWGLSRLNVFANVPSGLSPTGLIYLLMGDAEASNAVPAEDAFVPVEPIGVTVLVGANLRTAPSTESTVLASAPVGMHLFVDGISSDGAFLRGVTEEGQVVWISSQVVAPDEGGDLSSLPSLTSSSRTAWQAITLRTGATTSCTNAPSSFVAQSPDGFLSTIVINGADIRFDGTIVVIAGDGTMRLFVLQGGGFSGGVSVPAGFTVDAQLTTDGTGMDGLWSNLRPINDIERLYLNATSGIPQDVLFSPIVLPTQEEILATLGALNGAATVGGATGTGALNCARFRPTSPLGGMPQGNTTFFWDGVEGASSYRVNLYNDGGGRVLALETSGSTTSLAVNTSVAAIGGGTNFSWDVEALLNGQSACTTARASVVRDATAQFVSDGGDGSQATPTVCTWQGCS